MVKTQFFLITFAILVASTTQLYVPLPYDHANLKTLTQNALKHLLANEKPVPGQENGGFDLFNTLSMLLPPESTMKADSSDESTSNDDMNDETLPVSKLLNADVSSRLKQLFLEKDNNIALKFPDDVESELAIKNEGKGTPEMLFVEKPANGTTSEDEVDFTSKFQIEPQVLPYVRALEEHLDQASESSSAVTDIPTPGTNNSTDDAITKATLIVRLRANLSDLLDSADFLV